MRDLDMKDILKQNEYRFIQTNQHLGKHVILLGLAGSYSYGTNIDSSDIDIRILIRSFMHLIKSLRSF